MWDIFSIVVLSVEDLCITCGKVMDVCQVSDILLLSRCTCDELLLILSECDRSKCLQIKTTRKLNVYCLVLTYWLSLVQLCTCLHLYLPLDLFLNCKYSLRWRSPFSWPEFIKQMAQCNPGHVWGLPAFILKSIINKTNRRCLWVAVESPAQMMF